MVIVTFLLGMLGSSAPVNIPGSALSERNTIGSNFSPSTSSPLQQLQSGFLSAARFSHQDSLDSVRTTGLWNGGRKQYCHLPDIWNSLNLHQCH